uniref:Uncharacterized protein n=1 Tax=Caenorhabditis japonica TaxID=281687 RepID=A0A8R1EHG0_CAEJA
MFLPSVLDYTINNHVVIQNKASIWTKKIADEFRPLFVRSSAVRPVRPLGRVILGRDSFAFVQKFPVMHAMDRPPYRQPRAGSIVKGKVLVLEFSEPNANDLWIVRKIVDLDPFSCISASTSFADFIVFDTALATFFSSRCFNFLALPVLFDVPYATGSDI